MRLEKTRYTMDSTWMHASHAHLRRGLCEGGLGWTLKITARNRNYTKSRAPTQCEQPARYNVASHLADTLGLPLLSSVCEVANQLLLSGVYRDDRGACSQVLLSRRVHVHKLGITVWMVVPFPRLARALHAVPQVVDHRRHRLMAHVMATLPRMRRHRHITPPR